MEVITVTAASSSWPSPSAYSSSSSSSSHHHRRYRVSSSSIRLYKSSLDCHDRQQRIARGNFKTPVHVQNPFLSSNPISLSLPTIKRRRVSSRFFHVSAVFERFTERAIKAVIFSQKEARALGKEMVFTQHLLLGLIAEDTSPDGFLGSGITIDRAREAVRMHDADGPPPSKQINVDDPATDVPFSISSKRVFQAAVDSSRSTGCNFIAPEHIAIGLLNVGTVGQIIKTLKADANRMVSVALSRLQGELAKDGRAPATTIPPASSQRLRENYSAGKAIVSMSSKKQKAQFCVDLTARAVESLIDPVIGRHSEVQRIVQILCRRTKNNPILLGEPGVGKTAIAEGLAICIAEREIPIFLAKKRIMSLDVGLLMAGSKERGELEARVTGLIIEVKKAANAGDVILFIDEVHTLIGSGTVGKGKGSGLDIANLLKPALGRGELQCIASTTVDEYRTHFEKDKPLARRFQPVLIDEPTEDDAVRMLLGLREKYEAHHKCRFTLEAINAAVYLSARYIPDRHLPDKAIDLIDEAGSRACMNSYKRKKEQQTSVLSKPPDEYWKEIKAAQAMHEMILGNKTKNSVNGNVITGTSAEMLFNVGSVLESSSQDEGPVIVGQEDIAAVASLWSGVPVQQLNADERKILVGLDEQLRGRVVGQDEAVSAISRAMKRSRVGLKDLCPGGIFPR